MKIGIDIRSLYVPDMKGIGIYLENLLTSIQKIDSGNQYYLYYDNRQNIVKRKPSGDCFFEKPLSIKKGDTLYLWEQYSLPAAIKRDRIDVLHSPANTSPLSKTTKKIVTVHDTKIFEMQHKQFIPEIYYKKIQPSAIKSAERIICPSEFTKNTIIKVLNIERSKITVIYNGLNKRFRTLNNADLLAAFKQKLRLVNDFILSVGGETPSKNISNLIAAFAILKKDCRVREHLVITGIRNKNIFENHKKELISLGIENEVHIFGYLPEEELILLYNAASMFVYPSLYEGFGFPPIEAMACGIPVAASNATSIPEIVGNAALLFDGRDINDIAMKINTILTDNSLRHDLIKKGADRIKLFSWEIAAEKTLKVYRESI